MNDQLIDFKNQFNGFFDKLSLQISTFEEEKKENLNKLNDIKDKLEEIENFKKVSVVSSLNKQISQYLNEISILKKQLELSEKRNNELKKQLKENRNNDSSSSLSYDSDKSEYIQQCKTDSEKSENEKTGDFLNDECGGDVN